MIMLYFLAAFFFGIFLGGIYFFALWRAIRTVVCAQSLGVGYVISRMLSLVLILGVLASALSIGIHPFHVIAAMIGFFVVRVVATRWAQPPNVKPQHATEHSNAS